MRLYPFGNDTVNKILGLKECTCTESKQKFVHVRAHWNYLPDKEWYIKRVTRFCLGVVGYLQKLSMAGKLINV